MTERPIIFSGPMVRAILDKRKTQTRRVIKPQPDARWMCGNFLDWSQYYERTPGGLKKNLWIRHPEKGSEIECPYGVPGDRLWVRETHCIYQTVDHIRRPDGRAFSEVSDGLAAYRVDGFDTIQDFKDHLRMMCDSSLEAVEVKNNRWTSPRFMPKWAARIWLEVVGVRVERVQDISEEDAKAEGVVPFPLDCEGDCWADGKYKTAFEYLWNEIYGWSPNAWESNPWVWVILFKTLSTDGRVE